VLEYVILMTAKFWWNVKYSSPDTNADALHNNTDNRKNNIPTTPEEFPSDIEVERTVEDERLNMANDYYVTSDLKREY